MTTDPAHRQPEPRAPRTRSPFTPWVAATAVIAAVVVTGVLDVATRWGVPEVAVAWGGGLLGVGAAWVLRGVAAWPPQVGDRLSRWGGLPQRARIARAVAVAGVWVLVMLLVSAVIPVWVGGPLTAMLAALLFWFATRTDRD